VHGKCERRKVLFQKLEEKGSLAGPRHRSGEYIKVRLNRERERERERVRVEWLSFSG
jgi:hypothetical protein